MKDPTPHISSGDLKFHIQSHPLSSLERANYLIRKNLNKEGEVDLSVQKKFSTTEMDDMMNEII